MDDAGIKFMHSEGSNPCFMFAAECELFWSFQHLPVVQSAESVVNLFSATLASLEHNVNSTSVQSPRRNHGLDVER